jgi:hypothetical protein
MSWVGLTGILLSLCAYPFAFVEKTRGRIGIFMLAAIVHVVTAVVYYDYVQTNSADSVLYYFDPYDMIREPLRPGTIFVVHLTQAFKSAIGGTYLDYFLIYQAFGFWGIAFLMRTIEEIYLELDVPQPKLAFLVLFLPGVHFWTSAIGKDAPLFLACALAVWATMRLKQRFLMFALAIVIMAAFRPHIALAAIIALAVAAFFDPRSKGYVKLVLFTAAVAGAAAVAGSIESAFSVDVTDADSVSDFVARQSQVATTIGGTTAVVGASYPVRLLSLLFRPLFVDAQGAFGLIASVENVFLLFVVGTLFVRFRDSLKLARQIFFLRFALIFFGVLALMLALVYYNVGLGLRQKMMFMPGLLTFFIAVWAVRQVKTRRPALSYA